MMKSIVIGSLLVLAMGSQVSFAVAGAHAEPFAPESVGSSTAPVADAGVLGKPTHIRAKILIAPHNK